MNYFQQSIIFFCFSAFTLCGCDDNEKFGENTSGSLAEITGFSPTEGGAKTRLYITGKNFGTDPSRIFVRIGGLKSKVIGSNGGIIYCLVPIGAVDGTVEVAIDDTAAYVRAATKFKYIKQPQVTTLCGYVDEYGKSEAKDGSFDECGFVAPRWLQMDPQDANILYMVDGNPGRTIRKLDLKNRRVSTLITSGQGNWAHIRQISFTASGDTLLVANEQDADNATAVSILLRKNGFMSPQNVTFCRQNNSCSTHPQNGELYYNNRNTGELFRYDWDTKETKRMFVVQGSGSQYFIFFHPKGDYAYICVPTKKVIMKAEYDFTKKELKTPTNFCGKLGVGGNGNYADGMGTNTILGNPMEGVFVINDKYVKEGREDIYDFYFCDQQAHCVRILSPDGNVTTYAGRGSKGLDNNPYGYVDGNLLEEARFNEPQGLSYDYDKKTFYICELVNMRVRTIKTEE